MKESWSKSHQHLFIMYMRKTRYVDRPEKMIQFERPGGLMDKASVSGAEDWGFESLPGRFILSNILCVNVLIVLHKDHCQHSFKSSQIEIYFHFVFICLAFSHKWHFLRICTRLFFYLFTILNWSCNWKD